MTRPAFVLLGCLALSTTHCQQLDVYAVTRDYSPQVTVSMPSVEATNQSVEVPTAESTDRDVATSAPDAATTDPATTDESAACPTEIAVAGDSAVDVAVGSLTRSYVLHVPPTYDPTRPAPVVLDFHGAGGSGANQRATSPYPAVTDPEGVVMVFPDGVNGPIGTAWNVGPCCVPGVDDLAFVDALVADLKQRICVDSRRVYAVGVLTGGGMAHHLACQRPDVFAAVSPSAFDLLEETVADCTPRVPVSVVAFRGTADTRVPYDGGSSNMVPSMPVTFLGAQATFARWATIDGCTGAPSATDANGCSSYTECAAGAEVVLCTKQDGGGEPGDAALAWPILSRHAR